MQVLTCENALTKNNERVTINLRKRKKGAVNMFSKEKLVEELNSRRATLKELAQEIGIDESTLFRKMAGSSDFSRAEMQKIKEFLKLDTRQMEEIFFAN